MSRVPHPRIVPRQEWLDARRALLVQEKALTRHADAVSAARRRLPMVPIERDYRFDGPDGRVGLVDLFAGRRQLIVYHFMFDPSWDAGCSGCTGYVDELGDLALLADRDTTFVLISRAPLEKLLRYRAERGWTLPWVSSAGSTFNRDFHVTGDAAAAPAAPGEAERRRQEAAASGASTVEGERHGLSVFFRLGPEVFHCSSSYARGTEGLTDSYDLLDRTPYGRQEDFECSPPGWPQRPTYG